MPLDAATGVFYAVHGPREGRPLMILLPLMASFGEIFGADVEPVLQGYLERLTDRYRVLLMDYPSIGRSAAIDPPQLTADRVCADLLGVADAAGLSRFAFWGYSWGGNVGLQLASRTDRLAALVVGGWPALGAPYEALLAAARKKLPNPEASSLRVLRSPAQYAQWIHYGQSIAGWPERQAVSSISCSRRSTISAVTSDAPGSSRSRFSGAVANSAISTHRSRWIDTSVASSRTLPLWARTTPRVACASSTSP
jgi:pimeloyl-ACP methyl ester carboxylesterase